MAKEQGVITVDFIKHNLKYREVTRSMGKFYFPEALLRLIDWKSLDYRRTTGRLCTKCPLNEGGKRYNPSLGVACQTIIGLSEEDVLFTSFQGKKNLPEHAICQKK